VVGDGGVDKARLTRGEMVDGVDSFCYNESREPITT